ncbi:hypothetical protein FORMA_04790 [Formosa sp. Hel3_A1_48]|nr:hypothetical protein FORMA_04790 [Formosa sp. Hel3_A1_48]
MTGLLLLRTVSSKFASVISNAIRFNLYINTNLIKKMST